MMGKKKNRIEGRFIPLVLNQINSKAWKELSTRAVWVYIELLKKFKGENKNDLSLTYREVKYKMSSATFCKTIKELVDKGFIKYVRKNFGGMNRICNLYGLSDNWKLKSDPTPNPVQILDINPTSSKITNTSTEQDTEKTKDIKEKEV